MAPRVRRLLLFSGLALLIFAAIAACWMWVPGVGANDATVAMRLNRWANDSPETVRVMLGVTALGTYPFLVWFSLAVVALLLIRRQWRLAAAWVIVQIIGLALIQYSKLAFNRPRPPYNGEFATEDSLSFPSGHSLGSVVAFGLLAYLLLLGIARPSVRRIGVACCLVLIASIGFSRMVLGVHYLTDVVGGFTLGAAWLLLAIAMIEDLRFHVGRSVLAAGQYGGGSAATVIDS